MKLNYQNYHLKIDRIIDFLENKKEVPSEKLEEIQSAIDNLAKRYQNDDELGIERYKMAHAQALIYLQSNNSNDARKWILEAVDIRGFDYQKAKEIQEQLDNFEHTSSESKLVDEESEKKKKTHSVVAGFASLLIVFGSIIIGRLLGLAYFVLVAPVIAGYYLGEKFSNKLLPWHIKLISSLNLLTWFLPPLGLFVSAFTLPTITDKRLKSWKASLELLTTIGLALSLSNGIFGAINGTRQKEITADFSTIFLPMLGLAAALIIVWLSIRIHITKQKRHIFTKILLWIVSVVLFLTGAGIGIGVVSAYITDHTTDKSSKSATTADKTAYWKAFKDSCQSEAVKNTGVTHDAAIIYCGCISDQLSLEFTPEEANEQVSSSTSKYSQSIEQKKPTCANSAGLTIR